MVSGSRRDSVGGGGSTMNVPLMGPFYMFRLSQRGPGPPESATGIGCGFIQQDIPDELWIAFVIGSNFQYIAVHKMVATMNPTMCLTLPVLH